MALPTRQTRPAAAPGDETATTSGSWLMLAVLLLGQFMCIIDVLVVNVAMPSIAASLHASSASLQLVAAGLHTSTGALTWTGLAVAGLGLGLSVSPLLTQSLTHVLPARAADASGLLTTTVQLGQVLGVAAIGSVYLSRAAGSRLSTTGRTAASAAAMSGTACWLAALSVAGLLAAAVMVRAARGRRQAAAP